ncbi:MAG: hypothetical protein IJ568_06245 [Bacilli bacterium]|nr:hypothetical protein [Bacilli bacterium]
MVLNEEELEKYKTHPRVLEIRFILLFDMFEKELGYMQATKSFQAICDAFNCNMTLLQAIISKRFDIKKRSKTNFRRWRQEVIFASYVYGETLYRVAKVYFNIKPETIYAQKNIYDIETFLTNEWLSKFDDDVILCGEYAYRNEVIRFMEIVDSVNLILKKWNGDA